MFRSFLSLQAISDSTWLVDMGRTFTGYARIRFPELRPGQEIIMEYCDHPDTNGNVVSQDRHDRYIAAGRRGEQFCNKFNYHGFIADDHVTIVHEIICYETMQKIAGILGRPSDAEEYARKKELARKLVHREFYDENEASYGSGNYIFEWEDAISE